MRLVSGAPDVYLDRGGEKRVSGPWFNFGIKVTGLAEGFGSLGLGLVRFVWDWLGKGRNEHLVFG